MFALVELMQHFGLVPGLSLGLCHVPGSAPARNATLGLCPGHNTLMASEVKRTHPKHVLGIGFAPRPCPGGAALHVWSTGVVNNR